MDKNKPNGHWSLRHWEKIGLPADGLARVEQAFSQVIDELERGEWRLGEWANALDISEDEMFIEVDRHRHQSVAA